jgi:hypothetical protein
MLLPGRALKKVPSVLQCEIACSPTIDAKDLIACANARDSGRGMRDDHEHHEPREIWCPRSKNKSRVIELVW